MKEDVQEEWHYDLMNEGEVRYYVLSNEQEALCYGLLWTRAPSLSQA